MATEYPGNITRAPHYAKGNVSLDDELLASTVGFTQKGITIAAGQGVIPLGTVMGRVTASKKYIPYLTGAADGSQVPRGVLRRTVDTGTDDTAPSFQNNLVVAGILKNSKVAGADAGAITALNARVDTVNDLFIF